MNTIALRRLAAIAVIAGLASPVAAASGRKKSPPNPTRAADAAAVDAALLAVQKRLSGLKDNSPAKVTALSAVRSSPLAKRQAGPEEADVKAPRSQQAQIDELRSQIGALRSAAVRVALAPGQSAQTRTNAGQPSLTANSAQPSATAPSQNAPSGQAGDPSTQPQQTAFVNVRSRRPMRACNRCTSSRTRCSLKS